MAQFRFFSHSLCLCGLDVVVCCMLVFHVLLAVVSDKSRAGHCPSATVRLAGIAHFLSCPVSTAHQSYEVT